MEKIMTCKKCGIAFTAKHASNIYCPPCAKLSIYERKKRHQQSEKAKQRAKDRYNNEGGREYMKQPERKEYQERYAIEIKYGITIEQRNDMLKKQGMRCAICGKALRTGRDVCIDHNHATGKVRAILCRGCNCGLGYFKESIEIMGKAQDYILKHNGF